MIIKKILNNNVVITKDKKGNEIIAMGRGIAFGKYCGDEVAEELIDKIYRLSNNDIFHRFREILENFSVDYIEVSGEIIEMAEKKLGKKLNDSIYISLTDHLQMTIKRCLEGIVIKNMLDWEIKHFYQAEYEIGKWALTLIKDRFGVLLPPDEAGFIALHIADGQLAQDGSLANDIAVMIQEITNIVRLTGFVELNTESLHYYRFITHLKFFAKRMFSEKQEISEEVDEQIARIVRKKYCASYYRVQKIEEFLRGKYHFTISNDEKVYLTIHIATLIGEREIKRYSKETLAI